VTTHGPARPTPSQPLDGGGSEVWSADEDGDDEGIIQGALADGGEAGGRRRRGAMLATARSRGGGAAGGGAEAARVSHGHVPGAPGPVASSRCSKTVLLQGRTKNRPALRAPCTRSCCTHRTGPAKFGGYVREGSKRADLREN